MFFMFILTQGMLMGHNCQGICYLNVSLCRDEHDVTQKETRPLRLMVYGNCYNRVGKYVINVQCIQHAEPEVPSLDF